MTELSNYIKKELHTILKNVESTPQKKPRKSASLQKIKTLVNHAPLLQTEKNSINISIRKI